MPYDSSLLKKFRKFVKDPKANSSKVAPFLMSKINPVVRRVREQVRDFSQSRPYPAHQELLNIVGDRKKCFFVEVGGNDGYFQDPTYFLEKGLGWKGIIVEPLPIYKLCKKNRSGSHVDNSASISFDSYNKGVRNVELVDVNAMSVIKGSIENEQEWITGGAKILNRNPETITVEAKPVQSVIDSFFARQAKRDIDLFVVDVEGYEIEVIKGIDFSKNSPTYIMFEAHNDERKKEIERFLQLQGYVEVACLDSRDFVFKKLKDN